MGATDFVSFTTDKGQKCGDGRWRYTDDGRVELDGSFPDRSWPPEINQWRDLINEKAAKHGLQPHQLAAVMGIESGGRPGLCLKCPTNREGVAGCGRMADGVWTNHGGQCNHREGMGLMAVTLRTAKSMNDGKGLTEHELRNNNALNIDLGAKYLRHQMDRYGGDFVHGAVAYNAGSIRCGGSTTFSAPKESCPRDQFGVVQGCVRRSAPAKSLVCAPSVAVPGKFNCAVNYPLNAMKMNNSAVANFLGIPPPKPPEPKPPVSPPVSPPVPVAGLGRDLMLVGAAALLGYAAVELWDSLEAGASVRALTR